MHFHRRSGKAARWTQRRGGRSDVAALESLKDFSATPMRLCDRVDPPFRCVAWAYTHPGLTVPTPYYLLL